MRQMQEAAALAVGLDDAENGRLRAGADVLSKMKAKYGCLLSFFFYLYRRSRS
jgi:hypothetical protein